MNVIGGITALLLAAGWTLDAETDQRAIAEARALAVAGRFEELRARIGGFEPEVLDPIAQHATCAGRPESVEVLLGAGARAARFGPPGMDCMLRPRADPRRPRERAKPIDPLSGASMARLLVGGGAPPDALLPGAAGACASELVEFLLEKGAEPNASGSDGRAALEAAMHCEEDLPERLMAAGARVSRPAKPRSTALHALVEAGLEPSVFERRLKALLTAGQEVDARDEKGRTALALASGATFFEQERANLAIVRREAYARALIAAKADPNLSDEGQVTPLLRALEDRDQPCGALSTGEYLGRSSLTTRHAQESERARLETACEAQKRLLELLLDAGAYGRVESRAGKTPLLSAAESGCVDCLAILSKKGISLDTNDKDGRTVLHWLVSGRRGVTQGTERRAVKALVEAGARRDAKDAAGKTPYDLLTPGGRRGLGDLLAVPAKPIATMVERAAASSVLVEKNRKRDLYRPENAFDGKLSTCWCEGVEGDGIGEWLRLDLAKPGRVKAVRLFPACTDDPKVAAANNRLTSVDVALGPVGRGVPLEAEPRLQDLGLSSTAPVSSVKITIAKVWEPEPVEGPEGEVDVPPDPRKYRDTCICELEVDLE